MRESKREREKRESERQSGRESERGSQGERQIDRQTVCERERERGFELENLHARLVATVLSNNYN